jgi:hypothetical protein
MEYKFIINLFRDTNIDTIFYSSAQTKKILTPQERNVNLFWDITTLDLYITAGLKTLITAGF